MIFVGPSGCGKSTLLRMVAGLERVDSGVIRMDGKSIHRVPPRDRDIAMVFQNYALYPTMKVYDNMAFPLKMRRWGREEIRARVMEVAESLGDSEKASSHGRYAPRRSQSPGPLPVPPHRPGRHAPVGFQLYRACPCTRPPIRSWAASR